MQISERQGAKYTHYIKFDKKNTTIFIPRTANKIIKILEKWIIIIEIDANICIGSHVKNIVHNPGKDNRNKTNEWKKKTTSKTLG